MVPDTTTHICCLKPYLPHAKGGSDWRTDIVETSSWFPINNTIPSHGLWKGKYIFTYEDNVPSCPLPFLIFCIAPGTCERQAWPLPFLGPRWLSPSWGKKCNCQHQSPKGYILITSISHKHIMQIRHLNYLCYPTYSDYSVTKGNLVFLDDFWWLLWLENDIEVINS